MRLRRRKEGPHRETIVALIDVVFFLLVFFMLIGRMDASSPFELSPPISTVGAALPGGGYTISVAVDGRLALDGAEIGREAALARLSEAVGRGEAVFVRVNVDAAAPLRNLLPLMTALDEIGAADVVLVVTPKAP